MRSQRVYDPIRSVLSGMSLQRLRESARVFGIDTYGMGKQEIVELLRKRYSLNFAVSEERNEMKMTRSEYR